jgi:solute carrier family 6 GABA transporter-like protein 6/8/11/12/13
VITSIQDAFPKLIKKHEFVVLVVVIVSFLFGLPHITEVGLHTSNLFINFQMFCNRSPPNIVRMIKTRRMR